MVSLFKFILIIQRVYLDIEEQSDQIALENNIVKSKIYQTNKNNTLQETKAMEIAKQKQEIKFIKEKTLI